MICDACGNWDELPEGAEAFGPPVCSDCAGTPRGDLAAERYHLRPQTSADVARLIMIDRLLTYPDLAAERQEQP
jgi:hypothetical protein